MFWFSSTKSPNNLYTQHSRDFPGGLAVENSPVMQKTQETRVQSLGWEDPLEKGMATHSWILAWRVPWTEEPGRLQFIGLQRVRHDWSDWAHRNAHSTPMLTKCILILSNTQDNTELGIIMLMSWGLPWWLRQERICLQCERTGFDPWVSTILWRRNWQPTAMFLPGESQGQRSLACYSLWGCKRVRHDLVTKQQWIELYPCSEKKQVWS